MKRICNALLLLLATLLASCDAKLGSFDEDRMAAFSATKDLRTLYNDRQYKKIYDLGSPALKNQVRAEDFFAAASQSMNMSGRYVSSTLVGSSCFPNEVRLVYHSRFENGEFTEMIHWSIPSKTAELIMYKLSPGHLETEKSAQKNCPTG